MAMPEKKKSMTLLSPNLLLFIFIFTLMPTAFSQSMFPCTSKNKPLILPQLNKPNGPYTYDHMELNRWFSSKSPLKGVALLVHGLNVSQLYPKHQEVGQQLQILRGLRLYSNLKHPAYR